MNDSPPDARTGNVIRSEVGGITTDGIRQRRILVRAAPANRLRLEASGLLIGLSGTMTEKDDRIFYLAKVDNARFLRPVVPGDQLRLEVQLKRRLRSMGIFTACARVDGADAATCELMCAETTR